MDDLNPDDEWRVLLSAIRAYERDHRDARDEAEARAKDTEYPYRKQAMKAAAFHAEYINKLSILTAKVWRRASERAVP